MACLRRIEEARSDRAESRSPDAIKEEKHRLPNLTGTEGGFRGVKNGGAKKKKESHCGGGRWVGGKWGGLC